MLHVFFNWFTFIKQIARIIDLESTFRIKTLLFNCSLRGKYWQKCDSPKFSNHAPIRDFTSKYKR